jgi:hypothetical protein
MQHNVDTTGDCFTMMGHRSDGLLASSKAGGHGIAGLQLLVE